MTQAMATQIKWTIQMKAVMVKEWVIMLNKVAREDPKMIMLEEILSVNIVIKHTCHIPHFIHI